MAPTCEWTKVDSGEYAAVHHGMQLRVSRRPGKSGYDTYVGGHYAGVAAAVNQGKSKTIRLVERSEGREDVLQHLLKHPHAKKIRMDTHPTLEEAAAFDGIKPRAEPPLVPDLLAGFTVKFTIEGSFSMTKAQDFQRVLQGLREMGVDATLVTEVKGEFKL